MRIHTHAFWGPLGTSVLLLAGAVARPGALLAQETPPVSPADRAIYATAADSTEFPGKSAYVLLKDATLHVDTDGAWTQRLRIVRQALTAGGADHMGEISLSYDPTREELQIGWARVIAQDGSVVRTEPVHLQELDQPVARDAPVYTSRKILRASLGDIPPGGIVDLSYTRREVHPPLPRDIMFTSTVNSTEPVRRFHTVVDEPAGFGLRLEEMNLPDSGSAVARGGRLRREWSYDDIPPMEGESFAADSNGVQQWIFATGPIEWSDVAAWYDGLTADRYEVTPEMEAKLADVTRGSSSLSDSLRAVYRWVAQDIRYVSISLGLGGYQPRPPAEVLSTGVGDCKDKTTLFLALARQMGVEGYPVLVPASSRTRPAMPSLGWFNHMIAAIRPDGRWIYLDLTTPYSPYGQVYGALQGKTGVMLLDDGRANVVSFPESDAGANRSTITVAGMITEAGSFDGTYTEAVTGAIQYRLRREFSRTLTDRQRAAVGRNIAGRVFEGARVDSLQLFDGLDLDAAPRIWAHLRADSVLRVLPGLRLLRLRLERYGSESVIGRLEEDTLRRFPIDAQKVFGLREHRTEYRIRLPTGWTAQLPASVHADSPFGHYESTYEQTGRTLLITRIMRGTSAVLAPDREDELVDWLKKIWADNVEEVVLQVPSSSP